MKAEGILTYFIYILRLGPLTHPLMKTLCQLGICIELVRNASLHKAKSHTIPKLLDTTGHSKK